jgi:hypothetical protein
MLQSFKNRMIKLNQIFFKNRMTNITIKKIECQLVFILMWETIFLVEFRILIMLQIFKNRMTDILLRKNRMINDTIKK